MRSSAFARASPGARSRIPGRSSTAGPSPSAPRRPSATSSSRAAMASFDVLVIGGGPAGATSALLLARAGRKAALIEKTAFPRRKVCGEYIAPPAVAFLHSLGIPTEERVRRIAVWANNRALQAPLPAPYASTLAREDLDTVLLEKAREAGAIVFQPLKAL